jgi:hypothetical protein
MPQLFADGVFADGVFEVGLFAAADTPPPGDTIPGPYSFVDASDAALDVFVISNSIILTDFDTPTDISVTGGDYSVNSASFSSSLGTYSPGDSVRVRVRSSDQFSTSAQAILTVGGVTANFTATTRNPDAVPDSFSFADFTDVALSQQDFQSDPVILSGVDSAVSVSFTEVDHDTGEYQIDNGAWQALGEFSWQPGESLSLRLDSSDSYSDTRSILVDAGGVIAQWDVTTISDPLLVGQNLTSLKRTSIF